MPAETTYLDLNEKRPYMAAFMYLATVAYPENTEKRTRFVNACRAWIIKEKAGSLKKRIIWKREILAFSEARKIDREFNRAIRIIRSRSALVRMARLAFVKSLPMSVMPSNKEKFSINAYLQAKFKPNIKSGGNHPLENAYKRQWVPLKPILHLAMELENVMLNDPGTYQSLEDLLMRPEWVKKAVTNAETCRGYIVNPAIPINLNIQDGETIQLLAV